MNEQSELDDSTVTCRLASRPMRFLRFVCWSGAESIAAVGSEFAGVAERMVGRIEVDEIANRFLPFLLQL